MEEITLPQGGNLMGGGCMGSGYFNLVFLDPAWTPARQAVVCQVFSDLSQFLEPAINPYDGSFPSVNVIFRPWSSLVPAPPAGVAATASPYFNFLDVPNTTASPYDDYSPTTIMNGVLDGEPWKTFNGGIDSWYATNRFSTNGGTAQFAHGVMWFNWGGATFDEGMNWPPSMGIDLYSTIAHEALHMMGFLSMVNSGGGGAFGSTSYYSRYDLLLNQTGAGQFILDPTLCGAWSSNFNTAFDLTSGACNTFVDGLSILNPLPVFNPAMWLGGSSISHLDDDCAGLPFLMAFDTGNPAWSRIPLVEEGEVLCVID